MIALPRALLLSPDAAPATGRIVAIDHPAVTVEAIRSCLALGAAAILLTGCTGGADIQRLAVLLSVAEAEAGLAEASTAILAETGGILPAPLSAAGFRAASPRLAALVWNHESLARVMGASRLRNASGEWTGAFAAARGAVLLSAAAAGIPAYDTLFDGEDEALTADCQRSFEDGFSGRLTRNANQAPLIESVYGVEGRVISKTSDASQ